MGVGLGLGFSFWLSVKMKIGYISWFKLLVAFFSPQYTFMDALAKLAKAASLSSLTGCWQKKRTGWGSSK